MTDDERKCINVHSFFHSVTSDANLVKAALWPLDLAELPIPQFLSFLTFISQSLHHTTLNFSTTRTATRPTRSTTTTTTTTTAAAAAIATATSTSTVRNRDTAARATVRGGSNTPSRTLCTQIQISILFFYLYASVKAK